MRFASLVVISTFLSGAAMAQTMVEAAALSSAGAAAAAKSTKATGSAVAGALGNLSKTLDDAKGAKAATSPTANPRKVASKVVTLPAAKTPEIQPGRPERGDLMAVKEGATRAELVAKAGPPSFAITSPEDGHLVEVLSYTTKDGAKARVKLSDGKVSSVEWPESK